MNRQAVVARLYGQIQSKLGLLALLIEDTEAEVDSQFVKDNLFETGTVPILSTVAQVNFSVMLKEVLFFYTQFNYEMEMRKI